MAYDKFDDLAFEYYEFKSCDLAPIDEETGLLKINHEDPDYWFDKWWTLGYKKDEIYYNLKNNWIIGAADVEMYPVYTFADTYNPEEIYYYRTYEIKEKPF